MSRSGYSDDLDCGELNLYRGAVDSAIRGKRGQRLLRDLVRALEAMPVKELIPDELESNGQVCALGAVGLRRGLDMSKIDPEDSELVALKFDISDALAREVTYQNDEAAFYPETPAQRWERMYKWAKSKLKEVVE
jgi:hypothetical protein